MELEGTDTSPETKTVIYWIATATLGAELVAGGAGDVMRVSWASEIMLHLGYPMYVMYIIGFWKILGCAAITIPVSETLREWAYAGTFFEITGALASHILNRDSVVSTAVPIAFALITLLSWKLWKDRLRAAGPSGVQGINAT